MYFLIYFLGSDNKTTVKIIQVIPTRSSSVRGVFSHSTTAMIEAKGSAQEIRLALVAPTTFKPTKKHCSSVP